MTARFAPHLVPFARRLPAIAPARPWIVPTVGYAPSRPLSGLVGPVPSAGPALGKPLPKFRITFVLDLFNGPRERELSRKVLDVMLRNLFEIDVLYLRAHPETPLLYRSGVRYQEEPKGQEDWQDIPTTIGMGIADCEDVACWRAAELVVRYGIQARPVFKEQRRDDGSYLYHIVVRYPDGREEDPSRILGMR